MRKLFFEFLIDVKMQNVFKLLLKIVHICNPNLKIILKPSST